MQVSLIIIWKTGYFAYPFSWVNFVRGLSLIIKCGGGVVPSFWSCMYWRADGILHCSVICIFLGLADSRSSKRYRTAALEATIH